MPSIGLVKCCDTACPSRHACWRFTAPDQGAEQWWRDFHRSGTSERCDGFLPRPDAATASRPPPRPAAVRRYRPFTPMRARLRPPVAMIALAPVGAALAVGLLAARVTEATGDAVLGLLAGFGAGLAIVVLIAGGVLWKLSGR